MPRPPRLALVVLALASAFVLSACGNTTGQDNAQPGGPRKPTVTVIEAQATTVPLTTELPGRTSPYLVAEIRPQVSGIIQKRLFTEGGQVRAGQPLYQIDPATYEASVDSARATLARAEATLTRARLSARRHAELVKVEAVSSQANDDAQAALAQAEADVAAARAALKSSQVNLDYTRLASPITGRIGRSTVTRGALVTANQAAALATVQQLDPIYVDLTQSTAELLALRDQVAAGKVETAHGAVPVTLVLDNGREYEHAGTLAFSEVTVDESTGSVTLRAEVANPDGVLLPGMYVRARIAQGRATHAVLVPHKAMSRDPRGQAVVMIVNGDGKVEARKVTAEHSRGDQWIVTDGLAGGERIIIEGLQKVRAGADVTAEPAPAPAETAAADQAPRPAAN
ncbi:efflux RND transporter periplasmic adaptor subunit [Denitromonas iodatirespirans]|uniref:Efflux RND transporter periplasmic adaptor subunit n=1 Tax=Denitromonas iodatirespirans TaxID=2795389 RepID=A0A944D823_DENI1|nr:efflux RND transporter periplasmic adaptor subunit [Denitromonas iodatirespirans]MBT0959743.1 efflux RND transporter periplasmic adaptor subunit [Denitromonas iodatirespirans]